MTQPVENCIRLTHCKDCVDGNEVVRFTNGNVTLRAFTTEKRVPIEATSVCEFYRKVASLGLQTTVTVCVIYADGAQLNYIYEDMSDGLN
jgi:hypothetical protein